MTRLPGWDLFSWLVLRRVDWGGLARLGAYYFDRGSPVPGYLAPGVIGALIDAGLIELGTPELDAGDMRRAGLTEAGQTRYRELCRTQRGRPDLPVPPPQFATPDAPAGRRSSPPAPGGQPDPPAVPPMRWARREGDERMHALEPADVERAPAQGYAETLCGDTLPLDVVTAGHPSGELCIACVIRFASLLPPELPRCAQRGEGCCG